MRNLRLELQRPSLSSTHDLDATNAAPSLTRLDRVAFRRHQEIVLNKERAIIIQKWLMSSVGQEFIQRRRIKT